MMSPEITRTGLQRGLGSLTIWFAVLTHFQSVADRQTDRWTDISTMTKTAGLNE